MSSSLRSALSLTLLVLGACGGKEPPASPTQTTRSATREDCITLIDANVEAQLRKDGVTDPAIIDKRKTELRTALGSEVDSCIGRAVTDAEMTCVRSAKTPDAIDACLH